MTNPSPAKLSDEDLKAMSGCPWCGLTEHLTVRPEGSYTPDMPARPYRVVCHHIAHDVVEGPVGYGRNGAIAAWNRRAAKGEPPAPAPGFAEGIEAAAKLADVWAETRPDFAKSDNAAVAKIIAGAIREASSKIAAGIRSLAHPAPSAGLEDGWRKSDVPHELVEAARNLLDVSGRTRNVSAARQRMEDALDAFDAGPLRPAAAEGQKK